MKNSYVKQSLRLLRRSPEMCLALLKSDPLGPGSQWAALLSPKERQESKFGASPFARRSWLLGRLAAKITAGTFLDFPFREVRIIRGNNGAPELLIPFEREEKIFVSISHTRDGAAAVVSSKPVGVDLEFKERKFSTRAWNWAFTEEERALEGQRACPAYPERLAMWCAKEAAAKSWGLPLLNHLSEVRVVRSDWAKNRLSVKRLGSSPASAVVELMEADNFLLALAFAE